MGRFIPANKRLIFIQLAFLLLAPVVVTAQEDTTDFYGKEFLRYENYVYSANIKTVILEKKGIRLSDAAILRNSDERLELSFDDLNSDTKNYSYTFIHCNSGWQPTNIPVSHYLEGFTDDRIYDYNFSFNTRQSYTHYSIVFPNENLNPKLSGNYILRVFETDDPEKTIITRRWLYYDNSVQIESLVKRATVIADRYTKQEIDFSVEHSMLNVLNPFGEIKVILLQNGRWDNAITNLKPIFLKGTLLDYNYNEENTFNGVNEYRTFDTRSYKSQNLHMKRFIEDSSGIYAYVKDDFSRSSLRYSIEDDINGRYLVAIYEGREADREADYINVHFKLLFQDPLTDATPYVYGALTDWRILPEAKLKYNYEKQSYETDLFLKQGYYNYNYAALKDGSEAIDETVIEGNHFETENDYMILVYFTPPGSRYDQLVGWKKISSRNIY